MLERQGAEQYEIQEYLNSLNVKKSYKWKVDLITLSMGILLPIFIIGLFAEVIRRVFYYIVLGTLRPKKK